MTAMPLTTPLLAVPALAELTVFAAIPTGFAPIIAPVLAPLPAIFAAIITPVTPVPATILAVIATVAPLLTAFGRPVASVLAPIFTTVAAILAPVRAPVPAILAPVLPAIYSRIGRRPIGAFRARVRGGPIRPFNTSFASLLRRRTGTRGPFSAALLSSFRSALLTLLALLPADVAPLFRPDIGIALAPFLGEDFAGRRHDRHDERYDRRCHDDGAFHDLFPRAAVGGGMFVKVMAPS